MKTKECLIQLCNMPQFRGSVVEANATDLLTNFPNFLGKVNGIYTKINCSGLGLGDDVLLISPNSIIGFEKDYILFLDRKTGKKLRDFVRVVGSDIELGNKIIAKIIGEPDELHIGWKSPYSLTFDEAEAIREEMKQYWTLTIY